MIPVLKACKLRDLTQIIHFLTKLILEGLNSKCLRLILHKDHTHTHTIWGELSVRGWELLCSLTVIIAKGSCSSVAFKADKPEIYTSQWMNKGKMMSRKPFVTAMRGFNVILVYLSHWRQGHRNVNEVLQCVSVSSSFSLKHISTVCDWKDKTIMSFSLVFQDCSAHTSFGYKDLK